MKRLLSAFLFVLMLLPAAFGQVGFPRFSSVQSDGFDNLNRYNLDMAFSISIASIASRGINFNPRITYNSLIWQKSGTPAVWSPVVDGNGFPTWGWNQQASAGTPTFKSFRYRCVANDGSNQWAFYYYGFQYVEKNGTSHTFDLEFALAEMPDVYPECGDSQTTHSAYAADNSGFLLSLQGNGAPSPANAFRSAVLAPAGSAVDFGGEVADTNGNRITNNGGTWYDSIGRASLQLVNDTTAHTTQYKYRDANGNWQTLTENLTLKAVRTNFSCGSTLEYENDTAYLPVSLYLADGSHYDIEYEGTPGYPGFTTARISKITLPQGGYIQYSYSGVNCDDGTPTHLTRTVNDGNGSSANWTYDRSQNGGTWQTTVTSPATNQTLYSFNSIGLETNAAYYQGSVGGTPLQQIATTYTSDTLPNSSPSSTVTTIGGKQKRVDTGYDTSGNLTSSVEFDWDATILRSTSTTYSQTSSQLAANILDLQSETKIFLKGSLVSDTVNTYDDYGSTPLQCITGAAGHDDTNYGCSQTTRGNITKTVRYANPANQSGAITTKYAYDSLGNLVSTVDANNNPTSISYADAWGSSNPCSVSGAYAYPTLVTNALSQQTSATYNSCTGAVSSTKDANTQITTLTYNDPLLRLTNVGYPDGGGVNYSYTATQTTAQVVGGPSSTTTIDGLGRTIHAQTVDGTVNYSYGYDGQGATQSVSNPHQGGTAPSTTTHYDAVGRPKGIDYADGTSHASVAYVDNCTTVTDAASHSRKLCTDALGRIAQVYEDPSGSNFLTTYQYDGLDNLTDVLQNSGAHRHFLFDGLSRMVAANNPENSSPQQPASLNCGTTQLWTTCYGYDNNGNLTSQTDNGNLTITAQYDALNRLTLKQAPGINYHYGYDTGDGTYGINGVGRLVYSSNYVNADSVYSYDSMGRITRQVNWTPSSPNNTSIVTTAAYDLAGNISSLTYPDGRHVTQSRSGGHLNQVKYADWNGSPVNYAYVSSASYMPDGSPQSMTLGNGVQISYGKNSRMQLSGITATNPQQPFNGQTFLSKTYCYTPDCSMGMGNNGNIVHIQNTLNPGKTQTFGYDPLNRIASAQTGDGVINQSFNIDAWGNMSASGSPSSQYLFNGLNQVSSSGFGYDPAGRLTSVNLGAGPMTYGYDAGGHVLNVNGGSTATYTYDAEGQRVRKDVGNDWTEYVYFNGQPMAEKHADGSWSDYIYANGQRIARTESSEARIHLAGNNCSNCGAQYTLFGMPLPNYTIQSGDLLFATQYSAGSRGGLQIQLSAPNTWLTVNDQDGNNIMDDTMQNQWHHRSFPLPSTFVGMSFANVGLTVNSRTPAGSWNMYFRDIGIVQANGTVIPLYKSGTTLTLSATPTSGVTQVSGTTETGSPLASQVEETVYYLADHLNTAQMEFSYAGWPIWQGEFAPYGQEISPQLTANQYKFTGQERDSPTTETGLDTFRFRSLSSTVGRWMSPDPYLGSMDITNPQSLNRYAYVLNNPLMWTDPTGLNIDCEYRAGNHGEPGQTYCLFTGGPPVNSDPIGTSDPAAGAPNNIDCHKLAAGQVPKISASTWLASYTNASRMLDNFLAGTGPQNYSYESGSVQSQMMMSAYNLSANVAQFLAGGKSTGFQNFGLRGLISSGLNPTAQFIGSYSWSMSLNNGNLNISISNATTPFSLFYHSPGFDPSPPNRPETGWHPLGRINQSIYIQVPCS